VEFREVLGLGRDARLLGRFKSAVEPTARSSALRSRAALGGLIPKPRLPSPRAGGGGGPGPAPAEDQQGLGLPWG